MQKIGRSWEQTIFRNTTTEICHQSDCQEISRGRVYDSRSATIKIPFYFKSHTKCEPCLEMSHRRHIRQCKEKNRKSKTNFLTGRLHQSTEFVIRALLCEPFVITFGEILITVYYIICFISFQIFSGRWLHFGSYFRKHLRHFCKRNLIKVKLKAELQKGKIPQVQLFRACQKVVAW